MGLWWTGESHPPSSFTPPPFPSIPPHPKPLHSIPPKPAAEMTTYRVCLCFRRKFKAATNEPPEAIREVFDRYSENGVMVPEQLRRFLVEVQGEDGAASVQPALEAMREFRHHHSKVGVSVDAFFRYLFREDNSPLVSHSLGVRFHLLPLLHLPPLIDHHRFLDLLICCRRRPASYNP
uniref:Phosphoinositide phospholipase C 2 n=1 Tax=Anthurium amnicola TaxID=1678845 RepID=A0A1D1Y3Z3_9ARAE